MAAWFTWGHPATFHWGTIETLSLMPSPAGVAFNQVYAWLVGAAIDQPCSSNPASINTCSLTRPNGYQAQAVWSIRGPQSYNPAP